MRSPSAAAKSSPRSLCPPHVLAPIPASMYTGSLQVFGGRGVRCPLHVLAPVPASLHTGSLQVPKPPSLLPGGGPARLPVRPGPGPRCSGGLAKYP